MAAGYFASETNDAYDWSSNASAPVAKAESTSALAKNSGGFSAAVAAAGPYAIAGAAAFSLIAGAQQAETIRANAAITKSVSDMNARYAELDAYDAVQEGYTKEARYQEAIDDTVGAQREAYAFHNVDVNFGTAQQLQAQTKLTGFLNQLDIKNMADQKSRGYQSQAINIRLSGITGQIQSNQAANLATSQGALRGLTTLVSGYTRTGMRNLPGLGYDNGENL